MFPKVFVEGATVPVPRNSAGTRVQMLGAVGGDETPGRAGVVSASSGCLKGHGTFPKTLLFSQTHFLTAERKGWALGDGSAQGGTPQCSGEDSLGKGRDRGRSEEGEEMRKGKVEESGLRPARGGMAGAFCGVRRGKGTRTAGLVTGKSTGSTPA